jgi:error-prone DNA polymerase
MLADYAATGLTTGEHPLGLLRPALPSGVERAGGLASLPHEHRVQVAGLVVARQRPGTANGIVFMLLEDETGTINLVVPPAVYERHRLTVRTEPLVLAAGRLERHPAAGGGINVLVDRLSPLEAPDRPSAEVKDFSMLDERERARRLVEGAPGEGRDADEVEADEADFRAVAPAVMSFGRGRAR